MYTLTGKIKLIREENVISDKFKKREFVVTDESSQYPQDILFQFTQERCSSLDGYNEGDEVKVSFFIKGREWKSPKDGEIKYFNSLDAWTIDKEAGADVPPPSAQDEPAEALTPSDDFDDLPF